MTYVDQVLSWMPEVFKPQKKAFIALLGALMCFTGRATMRNLARCGAGSEKRLNRCASEDSDFLELNTRFLTRHKVISRNPQRVHEGSPQQAILIKATLPPQAPRPAWIRRKASGLTQPTGSCGSAHKLARRSRFSILPPTPWYGSFSLTSVPSAARGTTQDATCFMSPT